MSAELDALIEKWERSKKDHRSGAMMSLAESTWGEVFSALIVEDLLELREATK